MNNAIIATPREAPWIGVGAKGHWTDYREAMAAANLDFVVHQEKVFWNKPDIPIRSIPGYPRVGQIIQQPEELPMFANVRDTDNKVLGMVTSQYGVVQNIDAFSLLEPFTQAGGVITNAGMTEQGLVFMVLHMYDAEFLGDKFNFDVMCCNSFNTAFPLSLMMVPTRIICQNMYRKLMGSSDVLLRMRHGNQIDAKLVSANKAIGSISSYIDSFGKAFEDAADKHLNYSRLMHIIELLFPYPKPGGKYEVASRARVDEMRHEFYTDYYLVSDNAKYHDTALGFLNAYYDYLSHRNPGKVMPGDWTGRRLSGLVSGNDVKTNVIREVLS